MARQAEILRSVVQIRLARWDHFWRPFNSPAYSSYTISTFLSDAQNKYIALLFIPSWSNCSLYKAVQASGSLYQSKHSKLSSLLRHAKLEVTLMQMVCATLIVTHAETHSKPINILGKTKMFPSREADLNHRPKDLCAIVTNYSPPLYQLSYREWHAPTSRKTVSNLNFSSVAHGGMPLKKIPLSTSSRSVANRWFEVVLINVTMRCCSSTWHFA